MPPRTITFAQDVQTHGWPDKRREACLLYIWQSMPGITDSVVVIDDTNKQLILTEFLGLLSIHSSHIAAINHGLQKYGNPWEVEARSGGWKYWLLTLARTALAIKYNHRQDTYDENEEKMFSLVMGSIEKDLKMLEWNKWMVEIFEEAQRKNKEYLEAMTDMKKDGPQKSADTGEKLMWI